MKKVLILTSLVFILSPILVSASSCYSQWLMAYDNAMDQYSADLSYCGGRDDMGTHYLHCFDLAKEDLDANLNQAADGFSQCLEY